MYQPIADVQSRRDRLRRGPLPLEPPGAGRHPARRSSSGSPSRWASSPRSPTSSSTRAARQLAAWREVGINIGLAVNVSGREFADVTLVERVETHLRAHDIPPDLLTLEVTETEIMADLGAGEQGARRAVRPGHQDRHRRLRHGLLLAGLPAPAPGARAEDRPLLRDQPAERGEQPHHRPLLHHHGPLARPPRRGRGGRGRAHLRHAGRGRVRLHSGLLPVQARKRPTTSRSGSWAAHKLEFAPIVEIPDSEGAALMLMSKFG